MKAPEKGQRLTLAYTHPYYDKNEHRYLPDGFRFTDPTIVRNLIYTGTCDTLIPRCAVCGRTAKGMHEFMAEDGSDLIYISRHCLRHDSTTAWGPDVADDVITGWYGREQTVRSAMAGDSMARLVLALEDMEGRRTI